MKKLVIATHNIGKLTEIAELLAPIEIIAQSSLNIRPVEETGQSFVENAILKARYASKQSGLPALGDDSGLVVPALQGAPGLYSSRYAGINANDEANILKLLDALKDKKQNEREAFFFCAIALVRYQNDPMPIICSGFIKGIILSKKQGKSGFGYDPVFYLPKLKRSMAELSAAEKNHISHRGIALRELTTRLLNEL